MLRRYTSVGLQNHYLVGQTTLIGSSNVCDIVVKGVGVAERHALIEYHPVTRSYWMRDLGTVGGTFCNNQTVYGMVELKCADVLRFGKSCEYVFELPARERVRKPLRVGHSLCAEPTLERDNSMELPVLGTKIRPRLAQERFARSPSLSKRLCQVSTSDSDNGTGVPQASSGTAVSSQAPRPLRSSSLGRERSLRNGKLPALKPGIPASGHETNGIGSGDVTLPNVNRPEWGRRPKNNVGNQLLQRVIRLQQEVRRRDEEILHLKESLTLPSTTGQRAKEHLDEYRLALAECKAENEKLRAVLATDIVGPESIREATRKELDELQTEYTLVNLIYRTFFAVTVDELEGINQALVAKLPVNAVTLRDYSDVIGEVVKLLQDPFSFRLMEISAKCNRVFERENLSKVQKREVSEKFDNFLKQVIYPLSKALDTFLPVIRDIAVMARESAKSCTVFSQWSREFGDQITREGLGWELVVFKADELQLRFKDAGMSRHWLPPSIAPLLKSIVERSKAAANAEAVRRNSVANETSRSDTAVALGTAANTLNSNEASVDAESLNAQLEFQTFELKKATFKVAKLEEIIDQLRAEKEELIGRIDSLEEGRFNLDGSALRTRRAANNGTLVDDETPIPVMTVGEPLTQTPPSEHPGSIPRIELDTPSKSEAVQPPSNTPDQLEDLVQEHQNHARPPSDVSGVDSTLSVEEPDLEAESEVGDAANDGVEEAKKSEDGDVGVEDGGEELQEFEHLERAALAEDSEEKPGEVDEGVELVEGESVENGTGRDSIHSTLPAHLNEHSESADSQPNPKPEPVESANSEPPAVGKTEDESNDMIEFWHLALALAKLLRVNVPSNTEADGDGDGDQKSERVRRKAALDAIMAAMTQVLPTADAPAETASTEP